MVAASLASPAQATMSCWNETQTAAAKVRDLQSRLMVAALRCQAAGIDITPAYNRFVTANRTTIQGANNVIRAQFRTGFGPTAETQYDRFATALANAYGGDTTDSETCAASAGAAEEAAAAGGDIGRLLDVEDRLGGPPELPGGVCAVSLAEVDATVAQGPGTD